MSYPKVSIVTPSLNQGQFIEEAIQSVLSQDYPNIEYIVMDAGSTDGTLDVLKKYNNNIIWISEPDEGQPDAINKGWRMASGEMLTWLNSDDVLTPSAVCNMVNLFSGDDHCAAVYGDHIIIDTEGKTIRRCSALDFNFEIILYGINYICPAIFIRREVLERVGYLDINFPYLFDWEFYLRMASKQLKILHLPETLFKFRWHACSKTIVDPPQKRIERRMVLQKYRNALRFNNQWLDSLYLKSLNLYYRLKRQYLRMRSGLPPSFPPGNLVRWYYNYRRRT